MKSSLVVPIGLMCFMLIGCTKTPEERRSELENQTQNEIAEVRQDSAEERNEIRAEASEEVAEIRREAAEERRDIYLASIKNRREALEARVDKFEDRIQDKKAVTPEQAEWLAKVNGAEERLETVKELVDESTGENWKNLRPVVSDAYVDLYNTLATAERTVGNAKM